MEIAPNVQCITVGQGAFEGVYAPNVYLVTGRERAVFIDTAYGKDEEVRAHLGEWEAQGKPAVAAIILTHRHGDHTGGAVRLRDATGGPITCSAAEKDAIEDALEPARVDRAVADGETLDLGGVTLEFIHTPGHTLGSLCVFYREEGVLFSGDMILGTGTTVIRPDHGDMAAYIGSMHKLLGYDARIIAPGHGPVINTPQAKIGQLIEHRLARENQVMELLRQGHRTIEDLFGGIYPDLHPGLHDTARSQVQAHLIKLEREGRVRASGDAYQVVVP